MEASIEPSADDDIQGTSSEAAATTSKIPRNMLIYLPSITAHTRPLLRQTSNVSLRSQHILTSGTAEANSSKTTKQQKTHNRVEPGPSSARNARLKTSNQALKAQIASQTDQLNENIKRIRACDSAAVSSLRSRSSDVDDSDDEVVTKLASQIVSRHIKLLHRYNEIKDIGLGLMGMIADKDGKRLGEVMDERGVGDKD